MWSKKHIGVLTSLWLILDYRLYAWIHPYGYSIVALTIVVVGLVLARRDGVEGVCLRVATWHDWRLIGLLLTGFMVTLVPLGLALGFIRFNPTLAGLGSGFVQAIPIFILIALPEEIVFRGMIQKTIGSVWCSTSAAVALSALLFGLAHLHKGGTFPNWRYGLLAALAGVGYGVAFNRRGLIGSSLTHGCVDVIWRTFFR